MTEHYENKYIKLYSSRRIYSLELDGNFRCDWKIHNFLFECLIDQLYIQCSVCLRRSVGFDHKCVFNYFIFQQNLFVNKFEVRNELPSC